VNAGLVGADAAERTEVRKDAGAIGVQAMVRHESVPWVDFINPRYYTIGTFALTR
jgi:hypothetical protein